MREIKFRGISARNIKMIFWVSTEQYNDFWSDVKDETVSQFTGLHDKNGKEIYEGDIFRYLKDGKWAYTEEVRFDDVGGWLVGKLMLWALRKDAEIWGNIYENPELIKQS